VRGASAASSTQARDGCLDDYLLPRWRHRAADMCRSPFPHPGPVVEVAQTARGSLMPLLRIWTLPVVGFGMTIGEGKTAAAVMVGARHVKPLGMFHPEGKRGIVEVVNVFIYEYPEPRGPRRADSRKFAVGEPGRIPAVIMVVVQPGTVDRQGGCVSVIARCIKSGANGPHRLVHGKGPGSGHRLAEPIRVGSLI